MSLAVLLLQVCVASPAVETFVLPFHTVYPSFGASVDTEGDLIVVGDYARQTVRVYEMVEAGVFPAPEVLVGPPLSSFGRSVAVDDGRLAISSRRVTGGPPHEVEILERIGSTWVVTGVVASPSGQLDDNFGDPIDLYGDTLIVGATLRDTVAGLGAGGVDVFERDALGVWNHTVSLEAQNGGVHARFGFAFDLSADGQQLAVGSPDLSTVAVQAGGVTLFQRSGSAWQHLSSLSSLDPLERRFGASVAMADEALLVSGGGTWMSADYGRVHLYSIDSAGVNLRDTRDGYGGDYKGIGLAARGRRAIACVSKGSGSQLELLDLSNNTLEVVHRDWFYPGQYFGWDTALGDGFAVVGAPKWHSGGSQVEANVYAFQLAEEARLAGRGNSAAQIEFECPLWGATNRFKARNLAGPVAALYFSQSLSTAPLGCSHFQLGPVLTPTLIFSTAAGIVDVLTPASVRGLTLYAQAVGLGTAACPVDTSNVLELNF